MYSNQSDFQKNCTKRILKSSAHTPLRIEQIGSTTYISVKGIEGVFSVDSTPRERTLQEVCKEYDSFISLGDLSSPIATAQDNNLNLLIAKSSRRIQMLAANLVAKRQNTDESEFADLQKKQINKLADEIMKARPKTFGYVTPSHKTNLQKKITEYIDFASDVSQKSVEQKLETKAQSTSKLDVRFSDLADGDRALDPNVVKLFNCNDAELVAAFKQLHPTQLSEFIQCITDAKTNRYNKDLNNICKFIRSSDIDLNDIIKTMNK